MTGFSDYGCKKVIGGHLRVWPLADNQSIIQSNHHIEAMKLNLQPQ
jgi:hypothetical protein